MEMADSPRKRYARSPSPQDGKSRLRSRSKSRSPSRSWSRSSDRLRSRSRPRNRGRGDAINPGNTLYVTAGVKSVFLVVEPHSWVSRGFAFITMVSAEDANRCIKHLNQSVLDGRYITVEKSRRKRARTSTPGHYLGLKNSRVDGYHGNSGGYRRGSSRDDYGYRRSPRRSPYSGERDYSPRCPTYRGERDYSPYRGERDYSPRHSPYKCERDYSPRRPTYREERDYSPRPSPYGGRSRRDR